MLQIVRDQERNERGDEDNYVLIQVCDRSLEPVIMAGDFVTVARYAAPQHGDLVAIKYEEDYYVRRWNRSETSSSVVTLTCNGQECQASLSAILVVGVVREVRRPIVLGEAAAWLDTEDVVELNA